MNQYNRAFFDKLNLYKRTVEELAQFDKKVRMFTEESKKQRAILKDRRDDWRLYMGILFAYKLMEDKRLSTHQVAELAIDGLYAMVENNTKSMVRAVSVKNITPSLMTPLIILGTKYANMMAREVM